MNTITPITSYDNRPSFGAFTRPSQSIMSHFSEVINGLTPENRAIFVSAVDKYVKKAESCPVPIGHSLLQGYPAHYAPIVDGQKILTNKEHQMEANYILDVMDRAVQKAENKADADKNILALQKIFKIQ